MLLRRKGLPEEGEILLCEVSNIHFHSVFVKILEYGIDGMIHISEVSPGRIRNIRDYVKEGKYIVCKVLRVDKEKRHVDLSLRRVNEREKIQKNNQIKQEQRAEKLVLDVAKELKLEPKEMYKQVTSELFKDYDWLYNAFMEISEGKIKLSDYKDLEPKFTELLEKNIKKHIRPAIAVIRGQFHIKTFLPNGVKIIRDAFETIDKQVKGDYIIKYDGGAKYDFEIKGKDYSECEKLLSSISEILDKTFKNPDSEYFVEKKNDKSS